MKTMDRLVTQYAFRPDWLETKMAFLAGPRQVGKTFIAKRQLEKEGSQALYYNWDEAETARRYQKDHAFFESDARTLVLKKKPTIVFDEIHKRSRWKNELKGVYDRYISEFNFIVTGSARLDLLRSSGESLAGRYFLYRILPIGQQEYTGNVRLEYPLKNFKNLVDTLTHQKTSHKDVEDLLTLGGFPDPLIKGELDYRRKWAMDYQRLVLREDLRDLSRIPELDRVETLWSLLPERVGSPLSVRSLTEDLSASHEAVRTWLLNLEKLYSIFFLLPYSKNITRGVKKERKVYLMDWALHMDEAKRFENFMISSLFRSAAVWTDMGIGEFEIRFVRNGLGQEADFLFLKDKKPVFIGDVKLSDTTIDAHIHKMAFELGDIPIVQVVKKTGIFKLPTPKKLIVSMDRLLTAFP